jgi:hypothetical protein
MDVYYRLFPITRVSIWLFQMTAAVSAVCTLASLGRDRALIQLSFLSSRFGILNPAVRAVDFYY